MKFIAGEGTYAEQIIKAVLRARRAILRDGRPRDLLVTLSPSGRLEFLGSVEREELANFSLNTEIAGAHVLTVIEQDDPFEIWVKAI